MELLSDSRHTDHSPSVYSLQLSANESRGPSRRKFSLSPHPSLGDRVRPQPLRTATIDYGGQEQISRRKDLLWLIARLVKGDNQRIPSWTGFDIKFHTHETVMQDVVGYLPTINAPVTQLSTVN